ncbi:MAG TPA: hypothetical protein VM165_25715 [Planctomycetaceae bacterium]|nr:hypothetical protein [Planctomycetaceae bacterium]
MNSPSTISAAILVHEREPHWTPELQRQMADDAVVIRACSSLVEVEGISASYPAVVVVLDLHTDATASLAWLTRRWLQNAAEPVVVLGTADTAEWEWTLRGVGVTSFLTDPIAGRDLARLCRQLLSAAVTPNG